MPGGEIRSRSGELAGRDAGLLADRPEQRDLPRRDAERVALAAHAVVPAGGARAGTRSPARANH